VQDGLWCFLPAFYKELNCDDAGPYLEDKTVDSPCAVWAARALVLLLSRFDDWDNNTSKRRGVRAIAVEGEAVIPLALLRINEPLSFVKSSSCATHGPPSAPSELLNLSRRS